ncbi:MAG: hypothetical protein IJQ67_01280 [Bacilli bacterium]|nr:hypothetical protein [Bacilli bacterium]
MKKSFKAFLLAIPIVSMVVAGLGAVSFLKQTHEEPAVAVTKADHTGNYERWIDSWSQPGHLYIHYLRPNASDAEYDNYCLWIWQHRPKSLEGSLWAASNKEELEAFGLKTMSDHWMTCAEVGDPGTETYVDNYGRIVDVDLYNENLIGGKSGKAVTFEGATSVGFLVVKQSSMDGKTNWTSDGGVETYIKEFDQHFRQNGAMHLFIVSGMFRDYTFFSDDVEVKVNPVTEDTTGKYVSVNDTITDKYGVSRTSDEFSSLGVGYHVFVASFRDSDGDGLGDLRGVIDSLDYLEDLGVQVLWLTPIQESDSYHGYDIIDYFAVDQKFGSIKDYRELIFKAHQKGMKVLMDLVLNHTSKSNVWFAKSQWAEEGLDESGNTIEYRNMYHWKYETDTIKKYNHKTGNYETITVQEDALSDNPSWYRDGESHYYYYGKFGSGMPEINYENQATRDMIINMAKYWLSFGLDGFRLDAVKHIYMKDEVADTGSDIIITDVGTKEAWDDERQAKIKKDFDYSSDLTKNLTWWKEFANKIKDVYPDCFLVGENFDGWGTRTAPYYQALDSQFDFAAYYHICQYLYANPTKYGSGGASAYAYNQPKETFDTFAGNGPYALGDTGVSVPGGKRPNFIDGAFTSNHDVPRAINQVNGTWAAATDTTPASKITGTAQEIGRAKTHAAVTILTPGVSWIYYGDELGMSGNTDQHAAKYGTNIGENSIDIWYRQPFLWKDQTKRANYKSGIFSFELDTYNQTLSAAEDQQADADSMYNFYKAINEVKAAYPKNAKCTFNSSSGETVLIMDITGTSGNQFRIFINTGLKDATYSIGGMTQGYQLFKNIGNGNTNNFGGLDSAYDVLVYKK